MRFVDSSCSSQQLNTVPMYVRINRCTLYMCLSPTVLMTHSHPSAILHTDTCTYACQIHTYVRTYAPDPSLSFPHHSPVVHGAVQQLSQFSTMAPLLGHCRDACTPLNTATSHTHRQLNHLKIRT